jgi:addiction module RelE/StbE family toxin
MIIKYSPSFLRTLRKADIRIRNHFKQRILVFSNNPIYPQLRNHPLYGNYLGKRSIDITADWRAIYEEMCEGDDVVVYFIAIGTHSQLYK